MKKYVWIWIAGGLLSFSLSACNDKEHSGGDNKVDTVSTLPVETAPASATPDTVSVPPVDPSMDTTAQQVPKK